MPDTDAHAAAGPVGENSAASPATVGATAPAADRAGATRTVVVEVMLKAEILDPQGQAVAAALPRLGLSGVARVRQGKRFELELHGEVEREAVERVAGTLLSNPVIEDYVVRW